MNEVPLALDFVRGVVTAVFRTAVTATPRLLESPPGHAPDPRLVDLSHWYTSLSRTDQARVRSVIALAADQAVFGMLNGLDGSRRLLARDDALRIVVEAETVAGRIELTTGALHDDYRRLVDPMGELQAEL